jgi:hypothetical protein
LWKEEKLRQGSRRIDIDGKATVLDAMHILDIILGNDAPYE